MDALNFGGIQNAVKKAQADPTASGLMDMASKGMKDMDLDALGGQLGEVMKFLKDPNIVETTKKALGSLQSGNVLDVVLDNQAFFVDQMEKAGVVPASIIDTYKNDKGKLTKDIKMAQSIVTNLYNDPKAISNLQDALNDPKKFLTMIGSPELKNVQESIGSIIESPILKTLCQSKQFKTLLADPAKWVKTAQKFCGEL